MQISESDDILKIALSMVKGASLALVHRMEDAGVSLRDFFELESPELIRALSLNETRIADRYFRDEALFAARREMEFIEKHSIRAHFIGDEAYPWRLAQTDDAPLMLYVLGECDLNAPHPVGIVGTRRITPYGADFDARLVADLAGYFPDLTVVSGLAYGADAVAHKAALDAGVPTVAIVAHGLNTIYPAAHRDLARRIVHEGGSIVSEYPFGSAPYRQRFLERNRIVAAMVDALVVVESEIKGGAMSTANHAFNYNRDVFALPGRVNDPMSAGCNHLIRRNKASLITCAADLIEQVGWRPLNLKVTPGARSLFPELDGNGKAVYDYLRFEPEPRGIDQIRQQVRIPVAELMNLLTEMELDGILIKHPGNRYAVAT